MADELATPVPLPSSAATPAATTPPQTRLFQSEELFSGHREVLIAHGEQVYRLRLTRANKLILHK